LGAEIFGPRVGLVGRQRLVFAAHVVRCHTESLV
jgi:hypothetical protein